jgi:hypothetical protein
MKKSLPTTMVLCASLAVAAFGCRQKTDAKSELEKAASVLAREEPAQAPPPAASQPAQPLQPSAVPEAPSAPVPAPAQQMSQALAAYKAGNFEDAVTRLQVLRATPVMTPQQRIALNDAMAAVMTEIYSRAAKGDARAIQAVQQYEELQTRP